MMGSGVMTMFRLTFVYFKIFSFQTETYLSHDLGILEYFVSYLSYIISYIFQRISHIWLGI